MTPKFLADNDFNQHIIDGVLRREPSVQFERLRDVGLDEREDPEVLRWAADNGFIVISHDVNTMRGFAYERIARGELMTGLLLAHQAAPLAPIIESLLLIWSAAAAEEFRGAVGYLPI